MRFASVAEAVVWAAVLILGFAVAITVTVVATTLVQERLEQDAALQQGSVINDVAARSNCDGCTSSQTFPGSLLAEPKPTPLLSPLEEFSHLEAEKIDLAFALAVLLALDVEPTAWTVAFLEEWARNEGSHAARFNPLATTRNAPGSTCYNAVCVRHYPDFDTGVAATVATLNQDSYSSVIDSLREDAITDHLSVATALRRWGTVLLADKVDGGWSPSPN